MTLYRHALSRPNIGGKLIPNISRHTHKLPWSGFGDDVVYQYFNIGVQIDQSSPAAVAINNARQKYAVITGRPMLPWCRMRLFYDLHGKYREFCHDTLALVASSTSSIAIELNHPYFTPRNKNGVHLVSLYAVTPTLTELHSKLKKTFKHILEESLQYQEKQGLQFREKNNGHLNWNYQQLRSPFKPVILIAQTLDSSQAKHLTNELHKVFAEDFGALRATGFIISRINAQKKLNLRHDQGNQIIPFKKAL